MTVRAAIYFTTIALLCARTAGFAPILPSATATARCCSRCSSRGGVHAASKGSNEGDAGDDYDFEKGFRARLKKEGGAAEVRTKADQRSAETAPEAAPRSTTAATGGEEESFLSKLDDEGTIALGVLALAVALAIGSQVFAPTKSYTELSTKERVERMNRDRDKSAISDFADGNVRGDIPDVKMLFYGLDSK